MTVENSFSKEEIDNMTKALKDNIDLKLSSDAADQRYIKKLDGCISENLLSEDLINKVNARYENKRPEETGSGDEVNTSDFNLLKVQVNNNTTGITNLKNYVDSNVLTTNNKITKNYLDESIVSTLDNSRLKSVLIGMSDLSEDVKKKLSNMIIATLTKLLRISMVANRRSLCALSDRIRASLPLRHSSTSSISLGLRLKNAISLAEAKPLHNNSSTLTARYTHAKTEGHSTTTLSATDSQKSKLNDI